MRGEVCYLCTSPGTRVLCQCETCGTCARVCEPCLAQATSVQLRDEATAWSRGHRCNEAQALRGGKHVPDSVRVQQLEMALREVVRVGQAALSGRDET